MNTTSFRWYSRETWFDGNVWILHDHATGESCGFRIDRADAVRWVQVR